MNTIEIEVAPPLSRLDVLLLTWADCQRPNEGISRGFPSRACGIVTNNTDWEDIEESLDKNLAKILDAIINDLPEEERSAIHHQYLDGKYKGLIVFYSQKLENAKDLIQIAANKKGIW